MTTRIEIDKERARQRRLDLAKELLERILDLPLDAELVGMRDELRELRILLWEIQNNRPLQ